LELRLESCTFQIHNRRANYYIEKFLAMGYEDMNKCTDPSEAGNIGNGTDDIKKGREGGLEGGW
jgi:hypothetical protein